MSDRSLGSADPETPETSPDFFWFISQVSREDKCVVRLHEGQPTLMSGPGWEDKHN